MPDELATAIDAAQEAGRILRDYFEADYEIHDKGFRNPVTTADYASNAYLEERLRGEFPGYGWLSEETEDTTERLSFERLWVVDPLDGTKEFIEGVGQFVVSIGLVERGAPILGVLYNPVTEELFAASAGQGTTYNGEAVQVSRQENLAEVEILNSRSETNRGLWEPYAAQFKALVPIGSVAYKLGLMAAGKHDMFATLRPKNEWDVCAGHCLLNEAGAELRSLLDGEVITYNKEATITRPGLVGGNPQLVRQFLDLYRGNTQQGNQHGHR